MLVDDTNEEAQAAETATVEYDGGKDISSVVEAAAKAIPADDKPAAEAPKLAGTDQTAEQQQKAAARAWKAYKEGKEVGEFDPATTTLQDFLQWELGYNALGKEHRRTFEQVMRNVPLAHHNEQRTRTLEDNLRRTLEESNTTKQTLEQYTSDRKNLNKALMAATRGNFEPLKAVVEAYQQAFEAEDQPAPEVPEGYIAESQLRAQQAGAEAYNRLVTPHVQQLAERFQYPAEQINFVVRSLIEQEPAEYLTEARLQEILTIELPYDLEQLRERDPIKPAEPSPLEKQVAELQARLNEFTNKKVEEQNAQVKGIHSRKKAAPPGVATNPGGSNAEVADFDDAKGAREWLRKRS